MIVNWKTIVVKISIVIVAFIFTNIFLDSYRLWYWEFRLWLGV